MSDDFDWKQDDAIVLQRQDAIAVYANPIGHVVIRREADWNEESDTCIIVDRQHVLTLVQAILRAANFGEISLTRSLGGGAFEDIEDRRPDIDWTAVHQDFDRFEEREAREGQPKDRTAAARQKRYRDKHRNGTVTAEPDVTPVTQPVTPDAEAPLLLEVAE